MISAEEIMQSFHVIPVIVVAAYILAEILKRTLLKSDEKKTMIPIVCGIIGAIGGAVLFYVQPSALDITSTTILGAIADGAFSGIMATGCNQIYKQVKKFFTTVSSTDSES